MKLIELAIIVKLTRGVTLPVAPSNLPSLPIGLGWDTSKLAVNGTIKVVTTNAPDFQGITRTAPHTFQLTATGVANQVYYVWFSANVALLFSQWTELGPVTAGPDGSINYTDSAGTDPQRFYLLSQ